MKKLLIAIIPLLLLGCSYGNFNTEYDAAGNPIKKGVTLVQLLGEEEKSFSQHHLNGVEKLDWQSSTNNVNAFMNAIQLGMLIGAGQLPNFAGTAVAPQANLRQGTVTTEQPNEVTADVLKSRDEMRIENERLKNENKRLLEEAAAAAAHGGGV